VNGLLQSITYGASGTEFVAANWTWVSHTQVNMLTVPGTGAGNRVLVTAGDQTSELSVPSFDYTPPVVTTIAPNTSDCIVDPVRPTVITVTGTDFGLSSPAVSVLVAFGNPFDDSYVVLPITNRVPSLSQILAPGYTPHRGQLEQVSFQLPTGLGAQRAVRVVSYPTVDGPPSDAIIQNMTLENGWLQTFSYTDPAIDAEGVAVSMVLPGSAQEADCIAVGLCDAGGANLANVRCLQITGTNFGPSPLTDTSAVRRYVQVFNEQYFVPKWDDSAIAFLAKDWSDTQIVGYTTFTAATLRVHIQSVDAWGNPADQYSNPDSYTTVSPSVSNIQGATTGLNTTGGAVLGVMATDLEDGTYLNVTIGPWECVLLNGSASGAPVPPSRDRQDIILFNHSDPNFPPGYVWTIWAQVQ
jgi:hypothetical protein